MTTTTTPASVTYERQTSIGLHIPKSCAVVGVGGVGSWVALFLALAGVPELWLWDDDTVSDHNLNRLPLSADYIGKSKSEAMRDYILKLRPNANIYAMRRFSKEAADMMGPVAVIVCSTDSHISRALTHDWCSAKSIGYVEAAAEGEFGSIASHPAEFVTEEEANPGYASVPVWVGPCVMAASLACAHVLHNRPAPLIRLGYDANKRSVTFTHRID